MLLRCLGSSYSEVPLMDLAPGIISGLHFFVTFNIAGAEFRLNIGSCWKPIASRSVAVDVHFSPQIGC